MNANRTSAGWVGLELAGLLWLTAVALAHGAAPVVLSVGVPTNGVYVAGDHLDFSLTLDQPVTVDTNGGVPRLVLDIGGSNVFAVYLSGDGSNLLTFHYAVQAADHDADGLGVVTNLDLNGAVIQDAASNAVVTVLTNIAPTSGVMVDGAAPVAVADAFPAVEDTVLTGMNVLTNDTDLNGDTLTALLVSQATNGTVVLNPDGSFSYTPATNFFGTDAFVYQCSDGLVTSAPARVTITVAGVNDPPETAAAIPDQSAVYGTAFTFTFAPGTFLDVDGDLLSYAATNLQPGIVFDGPTRTFSGTPTQVGTNVVEVRAGDGQTPALFATNTFSLVVDKAPLRVMAVNKTKAETEPNPPLTLCYSGFVLGETEAVVDVKPTASTTATLTSPPGTYPIALSGGSDDHYRLVLTSGVLVVRPSGTPPASGTYHGLFQEATGVRNDRAGAITVTTAQGTSYSGVLLMMGRRYGFSGRFDVIGRATNQIPRRGDFPLTVELEIGSCNSVDELGGVVTDGAWVADLTASQATYLVKTNPAPQEGRYSFAILGGPNPSADEPFGHSPGTLRINRQGKIQFQTRLADGTTAAAAMSLTKAGRWPCYVPLRAGRGLLLGWLNVTNGPLQDVTGDLDWISPAIATKGIYTNGFHAVRSVLGTRYTPPTGTNLLIDLPAGTLAFVGGGLFFSQILHVSLGPDDRFVGGNNVKLPINIQPRDGTFSGYVVDITTHVPLAFSGVFLQKTNVAVGYCDGSYSSGRVTYVP